MNRLRIWVEIETDINVDGIDPKCRVKLWEEERLVEFGVSEVSPPPPPLPPLVLPKATKPRRKKR